MEQRYNPPIIIRSSAILTTSYVAGTVYGQDNNLKIETNNQLILWITFVKWSLTSMSLKIEFSDDNIKYYQDTFLAVSGGTATATLWEYIFSENWNYALYVPIKSRNIKVSVKGSWTTTGSSCEIIAYSATS